MKKIIIISAIIAASFPLSAQEAVTPNLINAVWGQFTTPDGKTVVGQDEIGNAVVIDITSGGFTTFADYYPGNGNCHSNNGLLVGQSMEGYGALITDSGKITQLTLGGQLLQGALEGITADGTRACGHIASTTPGETSYLPVYCEIDADGDLGEPIVLPFPDKDLLGGSPQFVTAKCISADGKTIVGQVMDASGLYCYPIVFIENGGDWTYQLPSEPMFNPQHRAMPEYPEFDLPTPRITDYMTPANKQKWEADLAKYEEGNSFVSPWDRILDYMTEEEYAQYEEYIDYYNYEVGHYYILLDDYWAAMKIVTEGSNFVQGIMRINSKGTQMAMALLISYDEGMSDIADAYKVVIFDLEKGTYREIESQYTMVVPWQILDDGTLVGVDPVYLTDYILQPKEEEYLTLSEYLEKYNPHWLPWISDNLTVQLNTGSGVETLMTAGLITFSADGTTMVGGYQGFEGFFTYIYENGNSDVKSLEADLPARTVIYNLQGVKVFEGKVGSELPELPGGIYIINGKKVIL